MPQLAYINIINLLNKPMHIFISYAKKDTRDVAIKLRNALAGLAGVTAWMDESLEAGEDWAIQIQEEIDRCDYMVVLLSPDVNRAPTGKSGRSFVLREIHYAQQEGKPIIPVMAQSTKMPVQLAGTQYIDFTKDYDGGIRHLVDTLAHHAGVSMVPSVNVGAGRALSLQAATEAVLKVLSGPFEWIEIPEGDVRIISKKNDREAYIPLGGQTFHVPQFLIAKYPVTNVQFEKFIQAGGYGKRKWWTDEGWQTKISEKWVEPAGWESRRKNEDHPVVGVSWYEAIAFCLWLREITQEKITLPTEQQWQRAAQGNDGRDYPWGKRWNPNNCNHSVGGNRKSQIKSVRQYEGKGDSYFKVVDMAGNAGEWFLSAYYRNWHELSGTDQRAVGGGPCNQTEPEDFRDDYREKSDPSVRYPSRGFRIARV